MSLKGVIFLKIWISEFFWIFLDFSRIYFDFNSFKKWQKGGIFLQEPRADVARHGTCVDATWHTRPRGSATRTHARTCVAWMWRVRMAEPRDNMLNEHSKT